MPRIEGVSDAQAGAIQPLRLMAHSSGVMWAVGLFETAFRRAHAVAPTLKDLASLKVSTLVGCPF